MHLYFTALFIFILTSSWSVSSQAGHHESYITPLSDLTTEVKSQVICLADNIYYEARGEGSGGKVAVAMVTLNRTSDPRFPKDICGVVKQKSVKGCQFSWFCSLPNGGKKSKHYADSIRTALYVYSNYDWLEDKTKGALFFHAKHVNPQWNLKRTITIGNHIFYK